MAHTRMIRSWSAILGNDSVLALAIDPSRRRTRQRPIGIDLVIPAQPGLRELAHPGARFRPSRIKGSRHRVPEASPPGSLQLGPSGLALTRPSPSRVRGAWYSRVTGGFGPAGIHPRLGFGPPGFGSDSAQPGLEATESRYVGPRCLFLSFLLFFTY